MHKKDLSTNIKIVQKWKQQYIKTDIKILFFTIKITKWGTKKKVVENTPQIPEIIFSEARKVVRLL